MGTIDIFSILMILITVTFTIQPLRLIEPKLKKYINKITYILSPFILVLFLYGMFFIARSNKYYITVFPSGEIRAITKPGIKLKNFGKVFSYDIEETIKIPTNEENSKERIRI